MSQLFQWFYAVSYQNPRFEKNALRTDRRTDGQTLKEMRARIRKCVGYQMNSILYHLVTSLFYTGIGEVSPDCHLDYHQLGWIGTEEVNREAGLELGTYCLCFSRLKPCALIHLCPHLPRSRYLILAYVLIEPKLSATSFISYRVAQLSNLNYRSYD